MSRQKVMTALEKWDGPIFSEEIDDLNTIYNEIDASTSTLEELGKTIEGFITMVGEVTTADGYSWFWPLVFRTGNGKILVLFPWAQDSEKYDGVELDRSIAIYREGKANLAEAKVLLERIQLRFYKILEKKSQKGDKEKKQ